MVAVSTVVDHVKPHRGDEGLFWNHENWQASCSWHHVQVKQALEAMFDRGSISAEALRLDSLEAMKLSRSSRKKTIGADGWPVG
jgi:hypothetical protein